MERFFSQYLISYAQALKELRRFREYVPKSTEEKSDSMIRWDHARERILEPFGLLERLIMISSQSMADYREMQSSLPLDIVKYFISRMIKIG